MPSSLGALRTAFSNSRRIPCFLTGPSTWFSWTPCGAVCCLRPLPKFYKDNRLFKYYIAKRDRFCCCQFIYSEDLARLLLLIVNDPNHSENIIISPDSACEISIHDVAQLIAQAFGYAHRLVYDTTKSDGQFRKTADNTKRY